jgi:hypothetical protein
MNAISIGEISKDETKHPCMHASEIEKITKIFSIADRFLYTRFMYAPLSLSKSANSE